MSLRRDRQRDQPARGDRAEPMGSGSGNLLHGAYVYRRPGGRQNVFVLSRWQDKDDPLEWRGSPRLKFGTPCSTEVGPSASGRAANLACRLLTVGDRRRHDPPCRSAWQPEQSERRFPSSSLPPNSRGTDVIDLDGDHPARKRKPSRGAPATAAAASPASIPCGSDARRRLSVQAARHRADRERSRHRRKVDESG